MQKLIATTCAVAVDELKRGAPGLPEHTLLAALLANAIQDLRGVGVGRTMQTRSDARRWLLNNKDRQPFSFLWICEMLSLDPAALRRAMIEKSKTIAKY